MLDGHMMALPVLTMPGLLLEALRLGIFSDHLRRHTLLAAELMKRSVVVRKLKMSGDKEIDRSRECDGLPRGCHFAMLVDLGTLALDVASSCAHISPSGATFSVHALISYYIHVSTYAYSNEHILASSFRCFNHPAPLPLFLSCASADRTSTCTSDL